MAKIKVYRGDTGEIVWVPEHWMDNPILKKPFRRTPSQKSHDLEKEAAAIAAVEAAALAALNTSASREAASPTSTIDPANAGDNQKE